jgi:hypothetical protein
MIMQKWLIHRAACHLCNQRLYINMAYAMTGVDITEDTIRVHHDEQRKAEYVTGLLTVIATAVLAFICNRQNLHTGIFCQLIAVALVIVAVIVIAPRSTTIEIKRGEAVLRKISQLLFFRRSRSYALHDFHAIRLIEQVNTVEEGYLVLFYTIVLQGHKRSLELLSTDDKKKGELLCKEIFSLLYLRGVGRGFSK